jgi:hypothetical protein
VDYLKYADFIGYEERSEGHLLEIFPFYIGLLFYWHFPTSWTVPGSVLDGFTGDFFCGSFRQNHVPWGRLSLWKWLPGISPEVKAAGAFGWRPTNLVVPKVEKIRSLNPLNADLNPICHLQALLGGATIVVVSRLRVYMEPLGPPRPVAGYLSFFYYFISWYLYQSSLFYCVLSPICMSPNCLS